MAIGKMRVLYFSPKGKMATIAEEICKKHGVKSDVIPPAYPCENEKIVFILMTVGNKVPDKLRQFAITINKSRAQNVAFLVDGSRADATEVMNFVRSAGANVCDEVLYLNLGLSLPFFKGVSGDITSKVLDWADRIIASVEN